MESLSRLLFSDASLLPALGQLAERKAAAGEGLGGASEEQPSILMQLLMSLEQHHMVGEGAATLAGGPAPSDLAAPDSPFDPAGLPDQPSWIPTGLFSMRVSCP